MLKKVFICCLMVLIIPAFVSSVQAKDKVSPQELIKKVRQGAKFLTEKGEAGVDEFNKKDGRFVWENSYLYLSECSKSTAAAHPYKPELVGKDLSNLQDPKGNYFALELCMVSQESPEKGGWIKYWWPKPGESEPSQKFAYVIKAEGTPYTVVGGFWSQDYTLEELNGMLQ